MLFVIASPVLSIYLAHSKGSMNRTEYDIHGISYLFIVNWNTNKDSINMIFIRYCTTCFDSVNKLAWKIHCLIKKERWGPFLMESNRWSWLSSAGFQEELNHYCDSRRVKWRRSCRDVKSFETSLNWYCGVLVPGLWGMGAQETGGKRRDTCRSSLESEEKNIPNKETVTDEDKGSRTNCFRVNTNFLSTVTGLSAPSQGPGQS